MQLTGTGRLGICRGAVGVAVGAAVCRATAAKAVDVVDTLPGCKVMLGRLLPAGTCELRSCSAAKSCATSRNDEVWSL